MTLLHVYRFSSRSREIAVLKCDAPKCGLIFERDMRCSRRETHFCCVKCINSGRPHTDEWKDANSIRNSGSGNPFFGKKHKPETIEKQRQEKTGRTWEDVMGVEAASIRKFLQSEMFSGDGNPFYDHKHTSESLELISTNHACVSGSFNPMYKQGDKIRGEHNGAWQGGITHDPYDGLFTDELKSAIRKRDKFSCAICWKRGFDVHHIDYNKLNSDSSNLITLCRSCHAQTNFNREKWIFFFKVEKS